MIEKFKLKHLDILIEEDKTKVDLSPLMIDVLGYKNRLFGKIKWFVKNYTKVRDMVIQLQKMSHADIVVNEDSHIKKPITVDHIPYVAMLELQSFVNNGGELSMSNHMAKIISIVTYDENRFSDYKSDSKSFKDYENIILNTNLFDMIGLYNWILKDLEDTNKAWQDRFFSVEVIDKDLEKAGGADLSQFNVINTIKSICNDFNCDEKQAWLKSYYLVQTNSYSKAYASFVQDNIRISKEAEYKAKNPGPKF